MRILAVLVLLSISFVSTGTGLVLAAEEESRTARPTAAASGEVADAPGLTEHLGQQVAVDAIFRDEDGKPLRFGDLLDRPVLLLPVYYSCPNVCNFLQGNMARLLPGVKLTPGKEFVVVSASFDATETPELARRRKSDYLAATGINFPADGWRFLTGDAEAIQALTHSIGFRFRSENGRISHPTVAVAIAPGGTIVRYLYGFDFLPFDVTMAMIEAARGQTGLSVKRVLSYCFSFDPAGKRYVLDFMRLAGAGIVGLLLIFAVVLLVGRKRNRARQGGRG